MVGHNNGIVDDQSERYGYTGQGVKMYFEFKKIIKDKGNKDIGNEADCNNEQVFELAAYQQNKKKEKNNR